MANSDRIERMRRTMENNSLDVLVLRLPENVLLLSGYWPMIAASVLLFPAEGPSICITPECYKSEMESSIWEMDIITYSLGTCDADSPTASLLKILGDIEKTKRWGKLGYEDDFDTVASSWNSAESIVPTASALSLLRAAFPACEIVGVTDMLLRERRIKTPYEVDRLRRTSEISCFGLKAFQDAVAVGMTGVELAAEVERATMIHGTGYGKAVRVRAYAQVTVGTEETSLGYRPNVISTTRKLRDGEVALLELGVVADGYWADRTRVSIAGTPQDEQLKIFEIVCRAQEAAIAQLRPGVSAADVDKAARSVISDAGYGFNFPHVTGHGLGFGYHESSPILGPHSTDRMEEGMLTSVEPGIYLSTVGGFRMEDDVLVTAEAPEVLGSYKKVLQ